MMKNEIKEYFLKLKGKMNCISQEELREVYKHIDYLAEKAGLTREKILSGQCGDVDEEILMESKANIDSVLFNNDKSDYREPPVYLGRDLMLCQMRWGGWVVCPTWNVDVAVGLIRDGIIEEALTRFVMQNVSKGDTFVNVGANFGYYTVLAAKLIEAQGKVYSFEANPIVFSVLLKTMYYAGFVDRINLYNRAVSNKDGEDLYMDFDYQFIGAGSIMYCKEVCDSNNEFWNKDNLKYILDENGKYCEKYSIYNKIHTKTVSLDTVLSDETVDWILCDAECAEPLIMLGAKKLISNSSNVKIVFEWGSRNYSGFGGLGEDYRASVRDMWNFLVQEGFKVRYIMPTLVNGETQLSNPLSFDEFAYNATHGDYLASRE